jgi:hypothetical protein
LLTYYKIPGGFTIEQDGQVIGRLQYTMTGCQVIGVPWFTPRTYPTAWAARIAIADAWVEEELLEEE